MSWNHNVHYHQTVLNAIPPNCGKALDVGCGAGALARELAPRCREVIGLDEDHECLAAATAEGVPNLTFVQGDFLERLFAENSFDFVVTVAALHHMPLRTALERIRRLLRPGGVFAVIGLYRSATPMDYLTAAVALPVSRTIRLFTGEAPVGAPISEPTETLRQIRAECASLMPGGVFRRRLFFRYSFVWQKPEPVAM